MKKHWYDFLWIASLLYLLLGFFNILFAWLGLLCFFISLVERVYMQGNLVTALLTGVWCIGVAICGQWFFLYFFNYAQPAYAFAHHYAPKYGYTLLFMPLLYLLNRGLSQALGAQEEGQFPYSRK